MYAEPSHTNISALFTLGRPSAKKDPLAVLALDAPWGERKELRTIS